MEDVNSGYLPLSFFFSNQKKKEKKKKGNIMSSFFLMTINLITWFVA